MNDKYFEVEKAYDVDNYLYFIRDLVDDDLSEEEVQFFLRSMDLGRNSAVLDLPCGHGRHSNLLAKYVQTVTGIDISQDYLEIARKDAKSMGAQVEYILGDMRSLNMKACFDAVIMVFTSFAMFGHEANLKVLKNIGEALRIGGRFCIELMNPVHVLKMDRRDYVFEKDGNLMIDRLSYQSKENRFMSQRIYIKNGSRVDALMSHELFSKTQLDTILRPLGLEINEIYGSCTGALFTENSHKMVLIGKKITHLL